MYDDRYKPRITNANEKREQTPDLQFFYDKEKLKQENRYKVKGQAFPKTTAGFNWGACLLTPVWGFYHNATAVSVVWIILALVPGIGFILTSVLSIICGIKGNDWAWDNNEWKDIDEMHYVQRKWAMAGIITEIVLIFGLFAYIMNKLNSIQL